MDYAYIKDIRGSRELAKRSNRRRAIGSLIQKLGIAWNEYGKPFAIAVAVAPVLWLAVVAFLVVAGN